MLIESENAGCGIVETATNTVLKKNAGSVFRALLHDLKPLPTCSRETGLAKHLPAEAKLVEKNRDGLTSDIIIIAI